MAQNKSNEKQDRIWQALKKYGINSEEELDRELKKLKPLNLAIMTSPIQVKEKEAVN